MINTGSPVLGSHSSPPPSIASRLEELKQNVQKYDSGKLMRIVEESKRNFPSSSNTNNNNNSTTVNSIVPNKENLEPLSHRPVNTGLAANTSSISNANNYSYASNGMK